MSKFTGQAWNGPIAGAVCSDCHGTRPSEFGQSYVNELCEYKAGRLIARLGRFQCGGCAADARAKYKAARAAELAAEPRCLVPGCKRRGTFRAGSYNAALICGRHLKAAQGEHQKRMSGLGGLGLFMGPQVSGPEVLKMATSQ